MGLILSFDSKFFEENFDRVRNLPFSSSQVRDFNFIRKNFEIKMKRKMTHAELTELLSGLPHLFGLPWYEWGRDFFDSRSRECLLVAANQIGKSSSQIRKIIHWATAKWMWPKLWDTEPRVFWYLYPSADMAQVEVLQKWEPEFLPRGRFKEHPIWGWEYIKKNGVVKGISFKSGVTLYFHSYGQKKTNLQAGTVHYVGTDEEIPVAHYDELSFRREAVRGYFSMVFTATLNQDFWRRALEERGTELEVLLDAWKRQVTMYDCSFYEDGQLGQYSPERIEQIKRKCQSETEIQRRVYGKFVTEVGRKYGAFEADRHIIAAHSIPADWRIYSAVDPGSGGATGHPSAIVFVAVRPDYKYGVVFRAWRGDGVATTAGDTLLKYQELKAGLHPVLQMYDASSKDFYLISARCGEGFIPAEKNHDHGEQVVNTLFKNDMLMLHDDGEVRKLAAELSGLMASKGRGVGKVDDDLADALRYAVMGVPWDFTNIDVSKREVKQEVKILSSEEELKRIELMHRRGESVEGEENGWAEFEEEFSYWNEQY